MAVTFDDREFQATLREYSRHNKRDMAEICNDRAARVCQAAIKFTIKADREKIIRELTAAGSVATKLVVSRKTGKFKAGKLVTQHVSQSGTTSVAARIVNAVRVKEGQPAILGKELQEAAQKLLTRRLRGIGYAKSGWIAALKKLWPYLPKKVSASEAGVRLVSSRGTAHPAIAGNVAVAEIVNQVASKLKTGDPGELEAVVTAGLEKGFGAEIANMRHYIEKKLQDTSDKYSAK